MFRVLLVTTRIRKEVDYYIQEVKDNEAQLQQMKEQQKDPYDIKKFEEVVAESRMMVPDSQRRLSTALQELTKFLETLAQSHEEVGEEWKTAARELLEKEGTPLRQVNDTSTGVVQDMGQTDQDSPSTNIESLQPGEAF